MRKVLALALCTLPLHAATGYQQPPKEILDVLNAPPPPAVSVSPNRSYLMLLQGVRYPPISDVSRPMLRLAGLRIDPKTNGPHTSSFIVGLTLKRIDDGRETKLALPADARVSNVRWSPDGKSFAFLNTVSDGIELWTGDVGSGTVKPARGVRINGVMGDEVQWLADSRTLVLQTLLANRKEAPQSALVPTGPNVQESSGRTAPVRTYQDLLANPRDEELFDYYAAAQVVLYDTATSQATPIGAPGVFAAVMPSPDARNLLVTRVQKPYSYLHPVYAFPQQVDVWDRGGKTVHTLARLPLAEVPIEGVRTGPRNYGWRPTAPATLVWVEAMDGGNPKEKVPHRDRILSHAAPFTGEPTELTRTEHRFYGVQWGERGAAMAADYERDSRHLRTFLLRPDQPGAAPKLLFERNIQDLYRSPGTPMTKVLPNGRSVFVEKGDTIFLAGPGASPQGDRPFLDRFNLATQQKQRLFQSGADKFEAPEVLLDDEGTRVLLSRESPTEPRNLYVKNVATGEERPLTSFTDPTPQIRNIKKELVTYQRPDGVPLSFTLYLPPDYKPGTRLPTVVWAYPREFTDADTAGQIGGSTQRFTTLIGTTHLFFLLRGYAVLDGASMPVVGTPETVNNTYIEQVVSSAKAAIDKAVQMGVTDPDRVGVGGHSYGAFMTANLLAHSNLFRAGIARSGAYNRTLTPFGFQSERRTLWEAPDVYMRMSPFLHAEKIKEPLLLIHGEADNNPGTFPIQSDRMYQAVRGTGGTVRYVTLPHESHGYAARESVEHTLHEMLEWFDKYVKNAPERMPSGGAE